VFALAGAMPGEPAPLVELIREAVRALTMSVPDGHTTASDVG